jgi:hypothetical protein
MRDWLGFAGIAPPEVPMIHREQQFAEKLHAYTLPRPEAPNSRVRDLVDMVLLIESGTLRPDAVAEAIDATFRRRASHAVPEELFAPPKAWASQFARLAAECRLEISAADAFGILDLFFRRLKPEPSA